MNYAVTFVWEEVQLIVERTNQMMANDATILNAAVSTGIAAFGKDGGKKAQASFTKMVNGLAGKILGRRKPPPSEAPRKRENGADDGR